MSAQPAPPFRGPGLGPCGGAWGGERLTPASAPHAAPLGTVGGRRKGRRKGERKGGKFQEPGLEQNKESVFLPFHQQTSTQEEVLKKKKPKPTHTKRRLGPGDGKTRRRELGGRARVWHVRGAQGLRWV